jgi:hypothetical protein
MNENRQIQHGFGSCEWKKELCQPLFAEWYFTFSLVYPLVTFSKMVKRRSLIVHIFSKSVASYYLFVEHNIFYFFYQYNFYSPFARVKAALARVHAFLHGWSDRSAVGHLVAQPSSRS